MRDAKTIRERLVSELASAVQRPGMFGYELYFSVRLRDISFVDDVEAELDVYLDELRDAGILTSSGVAGFFQHRRAGGRRNFIDEAASIYARVAARFGWLEPDRRLSADDLANAKSIAHSLARRNVTWADVQDALGEPSYSFGDVRAYAGDEPVGWVYFDFSFEPHEPGVYARDLAPPSALWLRNIRVPKSEWYSARFRFTPMGRQLRGGTGGTAQRGTEG